jgi:hypothetical protein
MTTIGALRIAFAPAARTYSLITIPITVAPIAVASIVATLMPTAAGSALRLM